MKYEDEVKVLVALCNSIPRNPHVQPNDFGRCIVSTFKTIIANSK